MPKAKVEKTRRPVRGKKAPRGQKGPANRPSTGERKPKIKKVGSGGFSTVYRVPVRKIKGCYIALKRPLADKTTEDGEILHYENCKANRIRSPAFVRTYYADEKVVLTEYCDGRDLESLDLERRRELVSKNFTSLTGALAELHRLGYSHCDIKPSNILVKGGRLKIADLGLCRKIPENGFLPYGNREYRGTLQYSSLEMIALYNTLRGHTTDSELAALKIFPEMNDVWSLGIMLFEAITGKHPFRPFREKYYYGPRESRKEIYFLQTAIEIFERPERWSEVISSELDMLYPYVGVLEAKAIVEMLNFKEVKKNKMEAILTTLKECPSDCYEDEYLEEYEMLTEVERTSREEPDLSLTERELKSIAKEALDCIDPKPLPTTTAIAVGAGNAASTDLSVLGEMIKEVEKKTNAALWGRTGGSGPWGSF
ncbi:MAG: protein kinase [Rickettsiales bacterium]|jgi:serine/threonine protein kinase|nr:protein kinase [Rickettsiales bacterium]